MSNSCPRNRALPCSAAVSGPGFPTISTRPMTQQSASLPSCSPACPAALVLWVYASRPMIFRAPEPPLEIPEVPLTPWLLETTARRGDKAAFIDGLTGRTLSYADWTRKVRRTAAGLADPGFREGSRLRDLQPEPAGLRNRVSRRVAARRHQHDDQPAVHRSGTGTAAGGCRRPGA